MVHTLRVLIRFFRPDEYDWMNFVVSKSNPFTYHHIKEKCNGGTRSVENGAILTKKAHRFLHILQNVCPEAYSDLQSIFRRINDSQEPVTQEFVNEIDAILEKVLITKEYKFKDDSNIIDIGTTTKLSVPEKFQNTELFWNSSDVEVATVDSNGIVKGENVGKAIITAMTKSGLLAVRFIISTVDLCSFCTHHYKSNRKIKKLTK